VSSACWEAGNGKLPTAKDTVRFFQEELSSSLMTLLDANPRLTSTPLWQLSSAIRAVQWGKPCLPSQTHATSCLRRF